MSTTAQQVAAIPPHIWEQDQATWKAWIASIDVSFHTLQAYKRMIAGFYQLLELPIKQVTEQNISDYEAYLSYDKTERTVRTHMTPIRSYWRFAQQQ